MHSKDLHFGGKSIDTAEKAIIMLHGRGSNAPDILSLEPHLKVKDFALIAPQATNNTWYPFSFLAKPKENEPWLSSALELVKEVIDEVKSYGIEAENIYFAGFSQGACLTLESVARNAEKFGGVVAFTGGLIGDEINTENYEGDFAGTPIFISSGNPDPHIPVKRIHESANVLKDMNAKLEVQIYDNRPHTITDVEIEKANAFIFK